LSRTLGFLVDIHEVVSIMVSKFKTDLGEPEKIIIEQFNDTDSLYLIAKSACIVSIMDEKKNN